MITRARIPMIRACLIPTEPRSERTLSLPLYHRESRRYRMRLSKFAVRLLVLLLALRVVLAPLTIRPAKSGQIYRARLVVSMRHGWPQQRLERFSSNSKLLKLFQGKHKSQTPDSGRGLTYFRPWLAPKAHIELCLPEDVRAFCLDRSAASPRC